MPETAPEFPPGEKAEPAAPEATPEAEPAAPAPPAKKKVRRTRAGRKVTFRNARRATVNVSLKCGAASVAVRVPAKGNATATVPKKTCQVTCTGAGDPLCPISLRPGATSLQIP
jgi:hypothetical protein